MILNGKAFSGARTLRTDIPALTDLETYTPDPIKGDTDLILNGSDDRDFRDVSSDGVSVDQSTVAWASVAFCKPL